MFPLSFGDDQGAHTSANCDISLKLFTLKTTGGILSKFIPLIDIQPRMIPLNFGDDRGVHTSANCDRLFNVSKIVSKLLDES